MKKKQISNISKGDKAGSRFAALHGMDGETSGTKKDGFNGHAFFMENNNNGINMEESAADKTNDEVQKEKEDHGDKSNYDGDLVLGKELMGINEENNKDSVIDSGMTTGGKGVVQGKSLHHGKHNRKQVDNKGRDKILSNLVMRGRAVIIEKNNESTKRDIEVVFEKEKNLNFLEEKYVSINKSKK